MKKTLKSFIISILLVFTLGSNSFAMCDRGNDLIEDNINKIEINKEYKEGLLNYIRHQRITRSEYNQIVSYVEQAKLIVGNEKNLYKLSSDDKHKLEELVIKSLDVIDLKATFVKNEKGETNLIAKDKHGNAIIDVTSMDLKDIVTNFNVDIDLKVIEKEFPTELAVLGVACILSIIILFFLTKE